MRVEMRFVGWIVAALALCAGEATAQDQEKLAKSYEAIEPRIRAEYEFQVAGLARHVLSSGAPASKIEVFQRRIKLLNYNKSALIAECLSEADSERGPNAPPIPPQQNLVLTTCIEEKVGRLQKFSELAAYADFFFPERVAECADKARQPEREKAMKPYAFLMLEDARLFDFAQYNACLMPPPT